MSKHLKEGKAYFIYKKIKIKNNQNKSKTDSSMQHKSNQSKGQAIKTSKQIKKQTVKVSFHSNQALNCSKFNIYQNR